MMKLENSNLIGLGRKSKAALQALLQSPMVEAALADAEKQEVEKRAVMVARLAAVPDEHAKACAVVRKKLDAAEAAVTKATRQLADAHEGHRLATVEFGSVSGVKEKTENDLTREIIDSADPRLVTFAGYLHDVQMLLRNDPQFEFETTPPARMWGKEGLRMVVPSKIPEAWNAIDVARGQAMEMRMAALTRAEITATLREIATRIRPALSACGYATPRVLDDHVLPPLHQTLILGDVPTPFEADSLGLAH